MGDPAPSSPGPRRAFSVGGSALRGPQQGGGGGGGAHSLTLSLRHLPRPSLVLQGSVAAVPSRSRPPPWDRHQTQQDSSALFLCPPAGMSQGPEDPRAESRRGPHFLPTPVLFSAALFRRCTPERKGGGSPQMAGWVERTPDPADPGSPPRSPAQQGQGSAQACFGEGRAVGAERGLAQAASSE